MKRASTESLLLLFFIFGLSQISNSTEPTPRTGFSIMDMDELIGSALGEPPDRNPPSQATMESWEREWNELLSGTPDMPWYLGAWPSAFVVSSSGAVTLSEPMDKNKEAVRRVLEATGTEYLMYLRQLSHGEAFADVVLLLQLHEWSLGGKNRVETQYRGKFARERIFSILERFTDEIPKPRYPDILYDLRGAMGFGDMLITLKRMVDAAECEDTRQQTAELYLRLARVCRLLEDADLGASLSMLALHIHIDCLQRLLGLDCPFIDKTNLSSDIDSTERKLKRLKTHYRTWIDNLESPDDFLSVDSSSNDIAAEGLWALFAYASGTGEWPKKPFEDAMAFLTNADPALRARARMLAIWRWAENELGLDPEVGEFN